MQMTKQEWESKFQILKQAHNEFIANFSRYFNGRDSGAEREVHRTIAISKSLIQHNPELQAFFVEAKYGSVNAYTEFFEPQYFQRDMAAYLDLMRKKIDDMDYTVL